jgi:hypothetical protein
VPELDQDLVNLIMLGLLGLIVLELLGVMGSLRRNRKAVDRLAKARERDNSWSSLSSSGSRPDDASGARPAEARSQPAQVAHEPQPTPVHREPEPALSGSPAHSTAQGGQPGAASQPAAVSSSAAAQPASASSVDTGASGASQEPQEQPFERDGRWWFRRGSELLIYDEATGQWLPAPSGPGGAPSATQPMPTTISDVSGATGQPSGDQGFWKCPTCGAVNGSTATTCRMCFTARP